MSEKQIIIYFGDYWDERWRRRQQLAVRLSEMPEVDRLIYVEMPVSLPEVIISTLGGADPGITQRSKRILKHGLTIRSGKVEIITPLSFLPYFRIAHRFASLLVNLMTYRLLYKAVKRHSPIHRTLLWISHPFAASFIGRLREDMVCYDCTEHFAGFKEWNPRLKRLIRIADDYITRKSDLIFTQTQTMLQKKIKINPSTFLAPNAVDFEDFNTTFQHSFLPDISKIKKPILGFLGTYNNRIDGDLLCAVADAFKECSLVFLGINRADGDYQRLAKHKNVYHLGLKPYSQVPAYLHFFDVCLIPYKADLGQSPLKLFDYLASGKPIVSMRIAGTEDFGDMITLADSHDKFIDGIRYALNDGDLFLQKRRKSMAKDNSWSNRADQIWNIIQDSMQEKRVAWPITGVLKSCA